MPRFLGNDSARRCLINAALVLFVGACHGPAAEPGTVRVFAAASTTDALEEVLQGFTAATGVPAEAVVGSSAAMARQIAYGAPADLFLSANQTWMDHLANNGDVGVDTRTNLLANRLVLVAPTAAELSVDLHKGVDLAGLLGDGRLALGDPAHVPAGQYAQAALAWMGAWEAVEPRLARTADVRGALMLVERGEAPLGIVYATDAAAAPGVKVLATFPAEAHEPIIYPLAVVRGRGESPGVRDAWDFLQSAQAEAIFRRHGFARP